MARILVIDDEEVMRHMMQVGLVDHEVQVAPTGIDGLLMATRDKPDLILLDVNMPGIDGYEVCRRLRADDYMSDIPVIFLTSQDELSYRLEGFDAGADDYVTKPFDLTELEMRIRAVLRRLQPKAEEEVTITMGDVTLDLLSREVSGPNGTVLLTPTEFSLLEYLMRHTDKLLPTSRILEDVWDYPSGVGDPALVRMHIRKLREKVEENPSSPKFIQTVGRQGYTIKKP